MKGYPAGMKCVVTFSTDEHTARIGQVVTVEDRVYPAGHPRRIGGFLKYDCQLLRDVISRFDGRPIVAHPICWMRPLEDPDEQTIETKEEVEA